MPLPLRFRPSGATLDNMIYVVGGGSIAERCSEQALDTVQAYDPTTNKWSESSNDGFTARLQVGLGVDSVNHLLYAIGGSTSPPDDHALPTVEVYDPTTRFLDTQTRYEHATRSSCSCRGEGQDLCDRWSKTKRGRDRLGGGIRSFEAIEWTTKHSVMPHPRLNSTAAVVDDKVYILGGEMDGIIISTVDVYDPSNDTWTTDPPPAPLPTARRFAGAAVVDNTIYTVGGEALVATVGQPFTYQITATNKPTSYEASPLPEGVNIRWRARYNFRNSDYFCSRLCCNIHSD